MAYATEQAAPVRRPPAGEPKSQWAESLVQAVEAMWAPVLAAMMIVEVCLLLYTGRGLTFYFDDWDFVTHDFGGGLHSLLVAHVGNISVVPIVVYKALFHLVGLDHYAVYRLVVIVLHLTAAGLVFKLAEHRIGRAPALLATALILFLGAAWEDLLWAFQVGYMLSIVGGLATWALLDRADRRADPLVLLCLVVATGSSSLGIPILAGVAVELTWKRELRRLWVIVVPAALYLLWYAGHGESQVTLESIKNAPAYIEDLAAAAFGGLAGRGLEWGRPLALLGAFLLVNRLIRPRALTPRLVGLLVTALALWIVTAVARSTISLPETSRYIYLGAVVIVLIGVELLGEITIAARATVVAAPLVMLFAVTGFGFLYTGGNGLRATSQVVKAELGALELAAAHAPPTYQPDPKRAPQIKAGPYLHTVRAIGSSPADTPAQILAADPMSRDAADGVLVALEPPVLVATARASASHTSAPPLVSLEAGALRRGRACVYLNALHRTAARGVFKLSGAGVLLTAGGRGAASVGASRFGDEFRLLKPVLIAGASASLSAVADASSVPWTVQVISSGSLSICGLSA